MKYIVEIAKEYEEYFKGILICGIAEGKFAVDVIAREDLEELNSDYINEHFGDLQDTAYKKGLHDGESKCRYCNEYQRGFEDGKKTPSELASNAEYQRGLDDAWEAARKIVLSPDEGGTSLPDLFAMFGKGSMQSVFRSYSASEAIAKLKGYEEKQKADNKIKVSDEVVWTEDENVVIVVTCVYTENNMEWCDGFCRDGKVYQILTEHARKTGRHFDIDKILEEMRHD